MLLLVTGKVRRDAAAIERNKASSLKWKWNGREGGRESAAAVEEERVSCLDQSGKW